MKAALIAAPSSGAGKTTVTLGVLRALARSGGAIRSAKLGPDYIDPRFHQAATGAPCPNLDGWAMSQGRLASLIAGDTPLLIEGAMGLFDGAGLGQVGSAADLAARFDLPVTLVVDCGRVGASIAAQVLGMVSYAPELRISGLILNGVGSLRHEAILRAALARPTSVSPLPPVIGSLPRDITLSHPSRHLGLVQAEERDDLFEWLDKLADIVDDRCDLDALFADVAHPNKVNVKPVFPPLGQRIAVARDAAFAFSYPHILEDWHQQGVEILLFSPLNNESVPTADAVFLPGGYPELHAGRLSSNTGFMSSLRKTAKARTLIYGECGGYMVLGDGLVDADGRRHEMAGLLRLETSFEQRNIHLGYRRLNAETGPMAGRYTGHEFHYSTELSAQGTPLFSASDADGNTLKPMGIRDGMVCGSYAHLIDRANHVTP